MLLFGTTKLFDKDLDLVEKRGKDIQKLEQIIQSLVWEEVLPRTDAPEIEQRTTI